MRFFCTSWFLFDSSSSSSSSSARDLLQKLVPPDLAPEPLPRDHVRNLLRCRPPQLLLELSLGDDPLPDRRRRGRDPLRGSLLLDPAAAQGLQMQGRGSLLAIVVDPAPPQPLAALAVAIRFRPALARRIGIRRVLLLGLDDGAALVSAVLTEAPVADSVGLGLRVEIAAVPVLRSELADPALKKLIGQAVVAAHAALHARLR